MCLAERKLVDTSCKASAAVTLGWHLCRLTQDGMRFVGSTWSNTVPAIESENPSIPLPSGLQLSARPWIKDLPASSRSSAPSRWATHKGFSSDWALQVIDDWTLNGRKPRREMFLG